jgi:hypothetical protein
MSRSEGVNLSDEDNYLILEAEGKGHYKMRRNGFVA